MGLFVFCQRLKAALKHVLLLLAESRYLAEGPKREYEGIKSLCAKCSFECLKAGLVVFFSSVKSYN